MTSPTNLLQLADDYAHAKAFFKDQGAEARKRFQAALIVSETDVYIDILAEREACASLAENGPTPNPDIAAAIRARGQDECGNTPYDEGPFSISNFLPR